MAVAYRKAKTISLPPLLEKKVERLAKRHNQTFSEFVRAALQERIAGIEARRAILRGVRTYGARKAKQLGVRTESDILSAIEAYRRGDLRPYAPARRR